MFAPPPFAELENKPGDFIDTPAGCGHGSWLAYALETLCVPFQGHSLPPPRSGNKPGAYVGS